MERASLEFSREEAVYTKSVLVGIEKLNNDAWEEEIRVTSARNG